MPQGREDEFYIGYAERAPAGVGQRVRHAVLALLGVAALLAVALPAVQADFIPSVFEFGTVREFVGWVSEEPHPRLLVPIPGGGASGHSLSSYSLVSFGKHGAGAEVEGLDGSQVRLRGTLIYVEDQTMIEVVAGSVEAIDVGGPPAPSRPGESLGSHSLVGEIVDSKCYFGVMNPATGKVHRACAARCLSGGVPPVFLVRDGRGGSIHLLLVGADGRTVNQEVLDRVAEPLRITGEVIRYENLLLLRSDPSSYTRVP